MEAQKLKYFTKFLPVEGEGDMGCKWQWYNNVQNTGWEDILPADMDAIIAHGLQPNPKFRKVKLFLCSRDIQVGDKVHGTILGGDNVYIVPEDCSELGFDIKDNVHRITLEEAQIMDAFKVIGEISPEAIWVKEGDEFDENEINFQCYDDSGFSDSPWFDYFDDDDMPNWREYPDKYKRIQIKGPCGHYH